MKKIFILFITLLCSTCVLSAADTFTSEDGLIYSVAGENEQYIIIEGCEDVFITLTVPAEIDGLPVREIAESAFAQKERITKIVLPDSVNKIGKEAFAGSAKLREVILPSSLEVIPESCFSGCVQLRNIVLPSTLTEIGDRAFITCVMIGKIKIPSSVVSIGYDAFASCESLILDCGENEYAYFYAEENHIDTSFFSSSSFILLLSALISIPLIIIVFAILRVIRKNIKKRLVKSIDKI